MDDSFRNVPLNVPKLSGFDKSHQNLLTTKCGTITPILVDELIPGAKANVKLALSATLPPLASDTFMRASVKCEAFFVPFRLLCGSFESWFTDSEKQFADFTNSSGSTSSFTARKGVLPSFGGFDSSGDDFTTLSGYFGSGLLSDYLGFKSITSSLLVSSYFSAMPFLAYHRCYHDWYRNSLIQREVFLPPSSGGSSYPSVGVTTTSPAGVSPYMFFADVSGSTSLSGVFSTLPQTYLADGKTLFDLRQRNFGLDYFTTATPSPQQGDASTVSFTVSSSTGSFSIAALRAANSIQQFRERNNIAGNLYVEQLYARYGVRPSDGVAQRCLYLGSSDFEIYSKGIFENSNVADSDTVDSYNNPFAGNVGAEFGQGRAAGQSGIVSNFEAKEPGYLMIMATLVPRVTYSSGIHRRFMHYVGSGSLSDLANPILQNVGPQPIYKGELDGDDVANVFGYTDRYAEFKTMEDELHGLVRDGESLESFALQRSFASGSSPVIGSSFLEIPTDYMDQVTNTTSTISNYGCWIDCYFDYKVAQPLAKYSLPSLQDPAYEHGKTIVIPRGGFKL